MDKEDFLTKFDKLGGDYVNVSTGQMVISPPGAGQSYPGASGKGLYNVIGRRMQAEIPRILGTGAG